MEIGDKSKKFNCWLLSVNIIHQLPMDNLYVRLNLPLGKENNINHHSSNEHLKISKIANFGWQLL